MSIKRTKLAERLGIRTEFVTETVGADDIGVSVTQQDVSNVMSHVKYLRDQAPGKDLRHVAEIPMVFWEKAVQEGWVNDKAAWKKWLNNPDNACFRTWQGKV